MKKGIFLSLITTSIVLGADTNLGTITIKEELTTKVINDVSVEEVKNADLAESITKKVPSVSIVRRNGIANDIILRGQKKDNINVLIDDAKIYGACPNRMDPPISHILSNNVESITVSEGPFDVENFGTLSGKVQVKTKEPKKELAGEVNLGTGSFGYKKLSATASGGTDKFKFLISASTESSDQYEDGDGNNFYQQQVKKGLDSVSSMGSTKDYTYIDSEQEAYEKKTLLSKAIYNIDDSSELKFSYTANRSDNVLYPTGGMDADYDNSDIYTIGYTKKGLSTYSKELNVNYFYSKVDHPMSTKLRNSGSMMYMTSHMKSSIKGLKIKNAFDIDDIKLTLGLDGSVRNWKSNNYMTKASTGNTTSMSDSFPSTDTTNKAIFSKIEKPFGKLTVELGARYDNSEIEPDSSSYNTKDYNALSANVFTTYKIDTDTKYFVGLGKSYRVPDARELYHSSAGNSELDQTSNTELDLGTDKNIGNLNIKTKLFYSKLDNYIYNSDGTFENIDAKIYGLELSGFYILNDALSLDYALAYQKGKKDGEYTDKDLAEISPLKANLTFNYENENSKFTTELIAVDRWDSYDESEKEQELAGYALVNIKYNNQITKGFDITLGVDNLFDKTYSSTNTYQDITYVTVNSQRVLINDPGRYLYTNLRYSF